MNYTDKQNQGNDSGMFENSGSMRSEQENRQHSDQVKAGEHNRQDEVGYDRTQRDDVSWRSADEQADQAEKKMDKAEKKVDKAEDKFAKGYVNDGERKLEKAEKKMDKAQEKLDDVSDGMNRNIDRAKDRFDRTADDLEHRMHNAERGNMGSESSYDGQQGMEK